MNWPTEIRPDNRFLANAWGGENIFLTGMAGTGKSTLLREFIAGSRNPKAAPAQWPDGSWRPTPPAAPRVVDVTAPTGIAALTIGGNTVHRWSGMLLGPCSDQSDEHYFGQLARKPYHGVKAGFANVERCETLVIDEISMLTGRAFGFLEFLFRRLRGHHAPWGGAQVIVLGDFLQLAPVRTDERSPYDWAFANPAWEKSGFKKIELEKIYRQSEPDFIAALAGVRVGRISGRAADILHRRVGSHPPEDVPRLFTHNAQVDRWNSAILDGLPGSPKVFHALAGGPPSQIEFLKKSVLCPEQLVLKPHARIMFIRNDPKNRWVNGSIGEAMEFTENNITVYMANTDSMVSVEREEWKVDGLRSDGAGWYRQFPMRLAYALTIHKSQGLTLERAYVDIRAAREPGQAYVGLSRCRTLEGLGLKAWFSGVFVSDAALAFCLGSPASSPHVTTAGPVIGTIGNIRTPDMHRPLRSRDKGADPQMEGQDAGGILLPGMDGSVQSVGADSCRDPGQPVG